MQLHVSKSRRRVAVVIPKYGLVGGAEGHTAELTNRLAGDGHYDVHVFANRWTNHHPGITFHRVPIVTFPKFAELCLFRGSCHVQGAFL